MNKKRAAWMIWAILAVLAVSVPFNPVLNQPLVLFPFFVVSAVIGLISLNVAMTSDIEEREEEEQQS